MIAICIFSLFFQTIFCEAACDGEVTSCGDCTSSSETFMQCSWCSSTGQCNGKLDFFNDCPHGGQWIDACADGSCSASDKKNIEVLQSSQCASTSNQCEATSCFVFLAKTTRSSASCVQFYQTDCKTSGCPDNCVLGNDGYMNIAQLMSPVPVPTPNPTPRQVSVYTPAGTCQTANFCKTTCGISASVTQNSVSWGMCCADCTRINSINNINGYCSNGCLESGPNPPVTPSPTQSTELSGRTNRDNCIACIDGQLQWKIADQPVWCIDKGSNCADSQKNNRFCYDSRCPEHTVQVSDCTTESSSQLTLTGNFVDCVKATQLSTQTYNTASKWTVSTVVVFIAISGIY